MPVLIVYTCVSSGKGSLVPSSQFKECMTRGKNPRCGPLSADELKPFTSEPQGSWLFSTLDFSTLELFDDLDLCNMVWGSSSQVFSKLLEMWHEWRGEGFHSQINLGNADLTLLVFIKRCFRTLNSVSVLYEWILNTRLKHFPSFWSFLRIPVHEPVFHKKHFEKPGYKR